MEAEMNKTKTNVMRLLEQSHIPYQAFCYEDTNAISGLEVASVLHENPAQVFKTLVTVGKSTKNYVFVVPVEKELNLKKAAAAVGDKAIAMIKAKELLPLTGYVHGGCSPIGMKKTFPTVINESAFEFESIFFSAGKIGYQVEVKLEDLKKILNFTVADIV